MPQTTARPDETRARQRADLIARRRRARTRLPLDVALRLTMDPHLRRVPAGR